MSKLKSKKLESSHTRLFHVERGGWGKVGWGGGGGGDKTFTILAPEGQSKEKIAVGQDYVHYATK